MGEEEWGRSGPTGAQQYPLGPFSEVGGLPRAAVASRAHSAEGGWRDTRVASGVEGGAGCGTAVQGDRAGGCSMVRRVTEFP